jgi:hypothetical protein
LPCTGKKRTAKKVAVRQGQKRTAKKALCRAPRPQTHDKGTVSAVGFGHFAVRLPENARQSGHCSFFHI